MFGEESEDDRESAVLREDPLLGDFGHRDDLEPPVPPEPPEDPEPPESSDPPGDPPVEEEEGELEELDG